MYGVPIAKPLDSYIQYMCIHQNKYWECEKENHTYRIVKQMVEIKKIKTIRHTEVANA